MQSDSRNTILFVVLTTVILLFYFVFVQEPAEKRQEAAARAAQAAAAAQAGRGSAATPATGLVVSRAQALVQSPRVHIDSPSLLGSVSLRGGRIDDLWLKNYRQTLAPDSEPVELLRPQGAANSFFADFGWTGANLPGLPGQDTQWTLAQGQALSPGHPVVLTYRSPQGLDFTRTIAVDGKFMFTVTDMVANHGAAPVTLAPYATVQRQGLPPDIFTAINVHQGAIGWLDAGLRTEGYKSWKKKGEIDQTSTGGWLGITDKYWMAALAPDQREPIRGVFRVTPSQGIDIYDASYLGQNRTVGPGQQVSVTTHLFAGAKTVQLLQQYTRELGIPELDRAVDWGKLWFLTRPVFALLEFFFHHVGNFGVAILMLTVCVRLLLFWPANKSYESATKMKKVQPEIDKIRQRFKDDPAKQQQETMAFYQRERINPFMGCLLTLPTIPIFFALYKVLSVTIEMRHAPFGFVPDLSAPDPTTIWNLFGLIPWNPASLPLIGSYFGPAGMLHLGIWALAYGFTTWLTQSMTPTTGMDPTQRKMMQFMPLVMMFVLARFTVGLLIYYTWSNLLSLIQQYVIMRRFKVENPIDSVIARLRGRRPAGAKSEA
jgi:YidC/Oxa1 family membrane protein insertase